MNKETFLKVLEKIIYDVNENDDSYEEKIIFDISDSKKEDYQSIAMDICFRNNMSAKRDEIFEKIVQAEGLGYFYFETNRKMTKLCKGTLIGIAELMDNGASTRDICEKLNLTLDTVCIVTMFLKDIAKERAKE